MAARKPSLKFSENKGTPTSGMAASRQKLLTDADKAKSRREQLRFGKKRTSTQVNSSARKQASGKGVVKRDALLKKSVRAARDEAASNFAPYNTLHSNNTSSPESMLGENKQILSPPQ